MKIGHSIYEHLEVKLLFLLSSMPIPRLKNKYLPVAKYIDDHFGVEKKHLYVSTILDELVNLQTLFATYLSQKGYEYGASTTTR